MRTDLHRRGAHPALAGALAVALAAVLAWAPASASAATRVEFSGRMGERALLVIDGKPRTLAPGERAGPVRFIGIDGEQARVEVDGQTVRLGAGTPVSIAGAGGSGSDGARTIVLTAGMGGHFVTQGSINSRPVQFMVDTGATSIALGRDEAERLGLDWKSGEPVRASTANGVVLSHRINLSAVRVGEVTVRHVDAVVSPMSMPYVLLGNSFLTRFQMRRDNDVMRLELR